MFPFLNIHLRSHPNLQDQNCISFEAWALVLPLEYLKSIIKTRHIDNRFSLSLLTSTPSCFHTVDIHCVKKPLVFNCPHFHFITHSHIFKNRRLLVPFFVSLHAFSIRSKIFIFCKWDFFQPLNIPKTFWSSAVLIFWHILIGTSIIFLLISLSWISPESCCPFT